MAYLSANGYPVSEGSITLPRRGRMVAEVRVAESAKGQPLKADAPVTLAFEGSGGRAGHSITGAVIWAGYDEGLWRVRIVGGRNRINREARPKYYEGIAVRSVLSDLLLEVGEVPGQLETPGAFERYVRVREPAYLALETILHAKYKGYVWRTNAAGSIDILKDEWPEVEALTVSENYPAEKRAVCLPRPTLTPGVMLPGVGRLDVVRHVIGPQLRTEVFYL